MKYDLAKKLLDAGYTFYEYEAKEHGARLAIGFDYDDKTYVVPILSELIQTCGRAFAQLNQLDATHWQAISIDIWNKKPPIISEGSTPEEAVAQLWLDLVALK